MEEAVKNFIRAVGGVNDRVSALDRLDINMERAPEVFCVVCKRHIYYLKNRAAGIYDFAFAPCEAGYPVRQDLLCPVCGNYLAGRLNGNPVIKTDRGFV